MNGPRGRTDSLYTVTGARGALHFFRCLNLLKPFSGVVRAGGIRTSFILHPCPEQWYLQCFRLFVHTLRKGCGTRHVVTGVHAFGGHAQNTGIYSGFCVFVQHTAQGCHKRSCLWRQCPKHWYLQRCCFSTGCGLRTPG